jgi:hypothetical protein
MNKAERRAVEAAEMKFSRYFAEYTRKDQTHNNNIPQKLKIFNLNGKIQQNKKKSCVHILRMDPRINTQQILQYKPIGHRDTGR